MSSNASGVLTLRDTIGTAGGRLTIVAEAPVSNEEQALRVISPSCLEGPEGQRRGECDAIATFKVVLGVWLQVRQHHCVQHLQP